MRTLVIICLIASCGCSSVPHRDTATEEMSTERKVKVCAFNILVGVMNLPMKGISAFEYDPCEENKDTRGVEL